MKVSIIGIVGVPASYGGFETLADELTKSLPNHDFLVFCEKSRYTSRPKRWNNCSLFYLPVSANGIASVFYDALSLLIANAVGVRVHLVLGVSGAVFLPLFKAMFPGSRYIVNVDGIESRRDKWGKIARSFLEFSEAIAVKRADVVVADNIAIAKYVEDKFEVKPEIIAYGARHFCEPRERMSHSYNKAMALCRIEPENNVHVILDAFERCAVPLTFIGNWSYSSYGRDLRLRYGQVDNISLLDPVYDGDTIKKIRNENFVYIHGHSVGGTNPSLVEAMAAGHLCVCFDCDFNRITTEGNALFFTNSESLSDLMNSIQDSTSISEKSFQVARERYTWKIISDQYGKLFER